MNENSRILSIIDEILALRDASVSEIQEYNGGTVEYGEGGSFTIRSKSAPEIFLISYRKMSTEKDKRFISVIFDQFHSKLSVSDILEHFGKPAGTDFIPPRGKTAAEILVEFAYAWGTMVFSFNDRDLLCSIGISVKRC